MATSKLVTSEDLRKGVRAETHRVSGRGAVSAQARNSSYVYEMKVAVS